VKKDHKDSKLGPVPPQYEFGGTSCGCIAKKPGDLKAHVTLVQSYFKAIGQAKPYSEGLATHFRVGPNYKDQHAAKAIFFAALASTAAAEGLPAFTPSIEPFDEGEAILDLLQHYAEHKLLSDLLASVESQEIPAMVKNKLKDTVKIGLGAAVETAGKAWDPLQAGASKAGQAVSKKCREGAATIVDAIKPVLTKVVKIIQEGMDKVAGGESKGHEEKETKTKHGGYVGAWKFEKTHIGKTFRKKLDTESPVDAILAVTEDLKKGLRLAVQTPLEKAAALEGKAFAWNPWVSKHIKWVSKKITDYILEVTTLDAMLEVAHKLGQTVHKLEDEGAKLTKREEKDKWIQKVSETLWQDLSAEATTLFIKTVALEGKVKTLLAGDSAAVQDPLVSLLGDIFVVHVKGLNALRLSYVRNLKATIHEKDFKAASRAAFRDAIFESSNLLLAEHWRRALQALNLAAQAMLIAKFEEEVWGEIKESLAEVDELIPEELKSLGLTVSALAFKVASLIVASGASWAFGKLGGVLEHALFVQEDSGEGT